MVSSWIFDIFMAFAGVSGTVGATTLSAAQLGTHRHLLVVDGDNGHINNWSEYKHKGYFGLYYNNSITLGATEPDTVPSGTQSASGSSASHTHSVTAKSGSASSLPPYYALAYIMRIA